MAFQCKFYLLSAIATFHGSVDATNVHPLILAAFDIVSSFFTQLKYLMVSLFFFLATHILDVILEVKMM